MKRKQHEEKNPGTLRRRAEERLLATSQQDVATMPTEDVQKLVHELPVHQIELEMQNEELRKTQQELGASRDAYLDLYDFAPVGYLALDPMGIIQEANLTAATMLGLQRKELIGKKLSHFVSEQDADTLFLYLRDVFAAVGGNQICEVRFVTADAELLYAQLESVAGQAEDGGPNQCRTALIDVSDRKRAEEEQQHLEEQLRQSQKMNAVGLLAGGVAHEFNNMLAAMLNNAEILRTELKQDKSAHADKLATINQIIKAGLRAGNLTRQLLAFGRKTILRPEVLNLNRLIGDSVKLLTQMVGERVRLQVDLQPALKPVWADASQISQVLLNLVLNARDAMPDGGDLTIKTTSADLDEQTAAGIVDAKPGPHIRLRVKDTGCGMNDETRRRMFEPFFTTKEFGKGSGLGLAAVYGTVHQAGGHVTVDSQPGRGTTVTVLLPVTDAPPAVQEKEKAVATPPVGRGATILVCEDNNMVRDSLSRVLEASGFSVLAADDGKHGLEVAAAHAGPIHALVTDVVMPKMNGPEVAKALRRQHPDLRVVYMSGYAPEAIGLAESLDGDADFLEKPCAPTTLLQSLSDLLNR